MTGDEKGEGIGADSISYGTHCPRSADTLGQLPVGDSIAVRDCKKLSPNLHLQGRTCYGDREIEASSCPSEVLIDLGPGSDDNGSFGLLRHGRKSVLEPTTKSKSITTALPVA